MTRREGYPQTADQYVAYFTHRAAQNPRYGWTPRAIYAGSHYPILFPAIHTYASVSRQAMRPDIAELTLRESLIFILTVPDSAISRAAREQLLQAVSQRGEYVQVYHWPGADPALADSWRVSILSQGIRDVPLAQLEQTRGTVVDADQPQQLPPNPERPVV